VGENYVELYPGTSGNDLPSGAALALRSTNDYVEADEVLSVLRGRTRERARATIQALGAAVDDQGPRLNAFLDHATGAVDNATDVATVLAKDHVQVAGLVDDAGQIMGAVGDRATAVEQLSRNGRLTFEALARRAADLRATLVELPATLASVRRTSALLGAVTTDVAPVVNQISAAVGDLEPAVTALEPAADEARLVLRELTATAPGLATTLGKARAIAPSTVKALPQVKAVLCQLNPAAAYLRPYARDLTSVLANLGSSTNFYDATGHAARLYAMVGQTSFAGINDQAKDALDLLQQYGLAGTNESNGYNPYPAPGDAGRPSGGEGGSGPSDYPAKYPRVRAAC
jgi:ABC-type transporter Mla subunit MlaD